MNGVAALHSQLLQQHLFHDFFELWPDKFNNKTNGVTPRRWMASSNPLLSNLIDRSIGDDWRTDLSRLTALQAFADDKKFRAEWHKVKQANKQRLAEMVACDCGVEFDPAAHVRCAGEAHP